MAFGLLHRQRGVGINNGFARGEDTGLAAVCGNPAAPRIPPKPPLGAGTLGRAGTQREGRCCRDAPQPFSASQVIFQWSSWRPAGFQPGWAVPLLGAEGSDNLLGGDGAAQTARAQAAATTERRGRRSWGLKKALREEGTKAEQMAQRELPGKSC